MRSILSTLTLSAGVFGGLLAFAPAANADLLLEPYLSYETGSIEGTLGAGSLAAGTKVKLNTDGVGLGARVGLALPIIKLGLDYSKGMLSTTVKEGPGTSGDADRSTLSAFVAAKLPLIRGYLGYSFMNEVNLKRSTGNQKFEGNAVKIGASFTGLPMIALNAEYIMSTYKKYNGTDIKDSGEFREAKGNTIMVSVSLPLEL